MQWYEPLNKFMQLKIFECEVLPSTTPVFEMFISPELEYPLLCLGVRKGEDKPIKFDIINLNSGSNWFTDLDSPDKGEELPVTSVTQLEKDTVLMCYDKYVKAVSMSGKLKSSKRQASELHFDFPVESVGKGTTQNTNGIIMQRDTGQQLEPSTSMCRDRKRTIEAPAEPAMHYQGQTRRGPIQFQGENLDLSRCPEVHTESIVRDRAYFLAKYCQTDGLLPGWTGWNQVLHKDSHPINNVVYLPIIDSSPTDKATVLTILEKSLDSRDFPCLKSSIHCACHGPGKLCQSPGDMVARSSCVL